MSLAVVTEDGSGCANTFLLSVVSGESSESTDPLPVPPAAADAVSRSGEIIVR